MERPTGGLARNAHSHSTSMSIEAKHSSCDFDALSCVDFERQNHIALVVDGSKVPSTVSRAGNGLTLQASIPAAGGSDATDILFIVPYAAKPESSADNRVLGIAFSKLIIRPTAER